MITTEKMIKYRIQGNIGKHKSKIEKKKKEYECTCLFYVLLTVSLSIILDNDQLNTHLLYFTIRSL